MISMTCRYSRQLDLDGRVSVEWRKPWQMHLEGACVRAWKVK